jgi:hypothetical protein
MAGGVLVATVDGLGLPQPVGAVGLILFLLGTTIVAILGVQYGRAKGQSIPRSVRFGLRAACRWLWFFLP